MADIKFSEMSVESGASIDNGALFAIANVDNSSDTGYSSYATTVLDVATKINKHIQYATDLPTFTNKTVFGALNELKAGGGGGGSSTLAGLTDVALTTPTDGQALIYDSATDKWVNGAGGGGNANIWEGTQAQYDALVAGGTVDPNIVYFISDGVPSPIGHTYSTTERAVGTWIDGKSVYELTIDLGSSVTLPSQDWYTTNIPNSDKAMILNARSVSPVGMVFPLAASRDSGSTVRLWNMRNSTVACQYIILEYVKASS